MPRTTTPTTSEVARELVSLCRDGRNLEAIDRHRRRRRKQRYSDWIAFGTLMERLHLIYVRLKR